VVVFHSDNPIFQLFLPARRYARAGICDSNVSVWLAVCLSVTAGIVSKRREVASWFLHHLIAPWCRLPTIYNSSKNSQRVTPQRGRFLRVGWVRMGDFCDSSTYKPPYLGNGARYDQGYYWTQIGNRIRTFDWYHNEWPRMTLNWPWAAITCFLHYTFVFGAHHENMNEHRPLLSAAKM